MRPLVIDASAAIAYVMGESGAPQVERTVRAREAALVPWLFWTEVINVLARRHRWSGIEVLGAVYDLEQLRLRTERPSRPTMLAVIDAVQAHGLTTYDAEYLVLAENLDAELLTGDAALAHAVGARAILIGSGRRLAEPSARVPDADTPRARLAPLAGCRRLPRGATPRDPRGRGWTRAILTVLG